MTASLETAAPTISNTVAIIVFYHPDGGIGERLRRVQSQVSWLIIVSNDDGACDYLSALDLHGLTYIQNPSNVGVGAALNRGLLEARAMGFAWGLLLDQDSSLDDEFMRVMAQTYAACPVQDKVAIVAANYRSPCGARVAYRTNVSWQNIPAAVTSGSLVRLAVIERVGGMCESYFIEAIDTEFCLRVRAGGMHVIASGRPVMTHGGGTSEERRIFGRTVLVGHHTAPRYFLQYRNLTCTLLHYGRGEPEWMIWTLLAMIKRIILVSLFEGHRLAKLRAMVSGVVAGITLKVGTAETKHVI